LYALLRDFSRFSASWGQKSPLPVLGGAELIIAIAFQINFYFASNNVFDGYLAIWGRSLSRGICCIVTTGLKLITLIIASSLRVNNILQHGPCT
jgi:hypothetical protein